MLSTLKEQQEKHRQQIKKILSDGERLYVQPSKAIFMITNKEIERAKKTLVNISKSWTENDLPKVRERIKISDQRRKEREEKAKLTLVPDAPLR